MSAKIVHDLTGRVFGKLKVIALDRARRPGCYWRVVCECGVEKSVRSDSLRRGDTVSCGCFRAEHRSEKATTHGLTDTSIYAIWYSIKARCLSPTSPAFHRYGGRGISVCDRWLDFNLFYEDMGDRPFENAQIDRIDNNGSYCKENCRWVTCKENQRNKSSNRMVSYQGSQVPLVVASELSGLPYHALWYRLKNKWSVEKLFNALRAQKGSLT